MLSEVLSEETRDELLIDLPVFDDEDERLGDVDLRRHVAAPVEEVTERLERPRGTSVPSKRRRVCVAPSAEGR